MSLKKVAGGEGYEEKCLVICICMFLLKLIMSNQFFIKYLKVINQFKIIVCDVSGNKVSKSAVTTV